MKSFAVNIAVRMNGECFRFLKNQTKLWLCLLLPMTLASVAGASENVPHRPFAQWADVPDQGQFVAGAVYEQSDSYDIWANGQHVSIPDSASGIHINQGYLALQYGITERWAADFNLGYTKQTYQPSPNVSQQTTSGVMDWSFGVRYQLCNEAWDQSPWLPTATFRAGAVMPGTFDQHFPFSPGLRATAIVPELLLRKHFAWQGFGSYGDGLYRWNRTTGNDQYIIAVGVFQQFKQWELDLGWRHLQTIAGTDISIAADGTISYPRDAREINDSLEAGVSYTTPKRRNRYGGQIRQVFNGNNSDEKFWFGFSVDFPIGGKDAKEELTP